jgi:hypothetical protein
MDRISHMNEVQTATGTTRRDFLKASTVAASAAVTGTLGIGHSVFAAGRRRMTA